jgi:hypothetical protein
MNYFFYLRSPFKAVLLSEIPCLELRKVCGIDMANKEKNGKNVCADKTAKQLKSPMVRKGVGEKGEDKTQRNDKENCSKSQLIKSQKSVYTIIRLLTESEAPQCREEETLWRTSPTKKPITRTRIFMR